MKNPTTLIIIIAVLSCAGASIFLAVRRNRRKSRIMELYNAARKLVKEQNLNASLREEDRNKKRERMRMIIALSWKQKERESFVFDPLEGVRIGRQTEVNNVVIPDDEVSLRHCVLYRKGGSLVLEDLRSTNGTTVTHGLRSGRVRGAVYVYDGDKIRVGSTEMLLHVFWIDSAYL